MATFHFTANLKKHLSCPTLEVRAGTVADGLAAIFNENPKLKSYILDDQDRLRKHVAVFLDGVMIKDRVHLTDTIGADADVHVIQALSGG